MKIEDLEKKIYSAARSLPPSDQLPYMFEKRIMTRIAHECVVDAWSIWGRLLWKASAPCLAIMLMTAAWALYPHQPSFPGDSLAQDLEEAVMAPIAQLDETW